LLLVTLLIVISNPINAPNNAVNWSRNSGLFFTRFHHSAFLGHAAQLPLSFGSEIQTTVGFTSKLAHSDTAVTEYETRSLQLMAHTVMGLELILSRMATDIKNADDPDAKRHQFQQLVKAFSYASDRLTDGISLPHVVKRIDENPPQ
jgi:hypothetical protein